MVWLMSLTASVGPGVWMRFWDSRSRALHNLLEADQLLKVTSHIPLRRIGQPFMSEVGEKPQRWHSGSGIKGLGTSKHKWLILSRTP